MGVIAATLLHRCIFSLRHASLHICIAIPLLDLANLSRKSIRSNYSFESPHQSKAKQSIATESFHNHVQNHSRHRRHWQARRSRNRQPRQQPRLHSPSRHPQHRRRLGAKAHIKGQQHQARPGRHGRRACTVRKRCRGRRRFHLGRLQRADLAGQGRHS